MQRGQTPDQVGCIKCYKKNINILNIKYPDQVGCMDRGMQAVPVLVEGGSQTQLTHPKNVYIQYESR